MGTISAYLYPVDHENFQFSSQVNGQSSISLDLNMFWKKLVYILDMVGTIILFITEMYGNKNKNFSWSGAFSVVRRGC